MSCHIRWDSSETSSFLSWTKELLHDALNSGKRPHILSSEINIENLSFGENAPVFEILEIGDLANDRFRGIFKLKYDGDAQIRLRTSIQANLLNIFQKNTQELGGGFALPKFPLASQPFSIPLFVNLSQIRLSGIIVVVFSKSKGLTLVFKNDPLENIKVSSSFDNVQVIEKFLQQKIENQIRDLFRDILPGVLHKVSQRWTTSNVINQIHSKLNEENNVERISIFEVNPSEPEISPANMLKLSTLTTSRLSFRLSVPPFPEVIDRPNLFKYESNFKVMGNNSKNIPIEIITNNIGFKLDNTLSQITKIQSKLYLNEKNSSTKLKRRTIKMNGKKKEVKQTPVDPETLSETTTLVEDHAIAENTITKEQEITKDETSSSNTNTYSAPVISKRTRSKSPNASPLSPISPTFTSPTLTTASFTTKPQNSQPIELSTPHPMIFEKFQHPHPLLTSALTPLKTEIFQTFRSGSPRKSQANLMSHVGIGYYNTARNDSPPPPYI